MIYVRQVLDLTDDWSIRNNNTKAVDGVRVATHTR